MRASDELPPSLWPFRASEIYAATLNGPSFVFAEPAPPRAGVILHDIGELRVDLNVARSFLRRPNLSRILRVRASLRVGELRDRLVRKHLQLRRLSIGFRASPSAPVHLWP